MVTIEPLSTENLREGIFCPHDDDEAACEMYGQLDAWLSADMLRGYVARSEEKEVYGFILYYPVEYAPVEVLGEGFYIIQCMWVRHEAARIGVGRALVESAMEDARGHGASGVAVTAFSSVFREGFEYMPRSFFERLGFSPVQQRGAATLLFARFSDDAPSPAFAPPGFKPPAGEDRVRVDVLDCSRCYVGCRNAKLVDKIIESLNDKVEVHHHDQNSRPAVLDKGMSSGVFVDGRLTFFGAPISEDDMLRALEVALEAYQTHTDRAPEA